MKEFNINEYVQFKLTDYGKEVIESRPHRIYAKLAKDGYYRMQMYEFMDCFAGYILNNGGEQIIKNNIIKISNKDLK